MLKRRSGYSWSPDRQHQAIRIRDADYSEVAMIQTERDPVILAEAGMSGPVCLGLDRGLYWWSTHDDELCEDFVYTTAESLTAEDVAALVSVGVQRRASQLARARAVAAVGQLSTGDGLVADHDCDKRTFTRRKVPNHVKIFVWQRDGGRCVECGGNAELEFDHIIPLSMGGSDTERNLQLLCGPCNRLKGGNLV